MYKIQFLCENKETENETYIKRKQRLKSAFLC